jgi:glycosyltransferase involved in cell wall biosynthesis/tetratricopeptide (TPR) repeat protein
MVTAFQQANQLLREGKLEASVVAYRSAISQNPDFYLAYHNLGEALEKLGHWEESVEAYGQALELKPEAAWSLLGLSQVLQQVGRVNEAQQARGKAAKIEPKLASFAEDCEGIKGNILEVNLAKRTVEQGDSVSQQLIPSTIKLCGGVKKKIAVVLHAYYPELLPELFSKLANLSDYDLFVTIPENVVDSVTSVLDKYTKNYQVSIVKNIGYDILPFLELIPELDKLGYKYVCKIHTKRDHPDFGSLWRECLLDGVLGDQNITDQIITAFDNNPSLQIVGSALLYMSMLGTIYDGHQKMKQMIHHFMEPLNLIEDWGFFGGSMFWSRITPLKYIVDQILLKPIDWEASKSGITMGWSHIVKRLLGLVSYINKGQVGLVDYKIIDTENIVKVLRINPNFVPISLPIEYRLKAYRLAKNNLFAKHSLIYKCGLLDPFYYLTRNPHLLENQIDCVEHYLTSNAKNYLSHKHQNEKITFSFSGSQLNYTAKQSQSIRLDSNLVSDLMGWKTLANKNFPSQHGIKVSIVCITYNHEKYISQALEGFVMQQTNFKFEVIIGDDCSTDKTPDIIQKYVDRYPDLFVFVRRTQNLGVRKNFLDLHRRVRGQYVALNEGDDYWTNPMKLQIQVDYLDSHPECAVCFHPVLVIDEDEPKKQEIFPLIDQHLAGIKFNAEHLLRRNFIQTNSVMYRWQFHDLEDEGFTSYLQPGDWYNHLLHAQYGQIHMLEKVMSVYRKHPGGIWSTAKDHIARLRRWGNEHIHFFRIVNHNLGHRYHFHLLFSMTNMFIDLAKEYFEKSEISNLYQLIDKNRDIAPIAFYYLNWPIDINKIFSSQDLINEFRKVFTVSTVITSYNHEEYIEQCLESVVSQKGFFDHDVIIADDFSTDNTREIINKYAKAYPDIIRVLPTGENLGMLQNLKRAFTACKGNFIAICEGDDYWLSPTKLHKQLLFLLKKPELPMCFNWILLYKQSEQTFNPHAQQENINGDRITFDQLLPVDLSANFSCCFYRREAIESIPNSYYQEASAADWLFNLCIAHKADLGFIKELLSVYRLNEKGQWSGLSPKEQADRIQKEYLRFMEYFPDRKKYIQNLIIDDYSIVSNYKIPKYLEDSPDKNTFFSIDKLESIYGILNIRGWLLNINYDSAQNEDKFLFIIDNNGNVCYSKLLENQMRPDVAQIYDEKFPKKVTVRNWSGFKGIFNPQLSDGGYRLAIGKYADGRIIYKITSNLFEVTKGSLTIN